LGWDKTARVAAGLAAAAVAASAVFVCASSADEQTPSLAQVFLYETDEKQIGLCKWR
jgi:hypothetical protein